MSASVVEMKARDIQIDARGSHDSVKAAVHRVMRSYIPHMVGASVQVVGEKQRRSLMRELERSLAYEHCLGVLNGHCASAENEHGDECFDLESASPSSDIRALLHDVVRYLEWRGLLERNAKDPRWVIVHDEDPEVVA